MMLSGVKWEGYGGYGYGVREGKGCDVERCEVGRLWGYGYGVREGKVCDVQRCALEGL
jgi:hypothetical protein